MANTSDYKLSDNTPVHAVEGFDTKSGLFLKSEIKGLAPFGPNHGIITDEKLTPNIVEFLLSKKDDEGKSIYSEYLIKKTKTDK